MQFSCANKVLYLFYFQEIISASVASRHVFTCQQLGKILSLINYVLVTLRCPTPGIILMHLKYSSERKAAAAMLAPQVSGTVFHSS